jgi:aryl-alcohol dehydrogenase-like predicted oxidoreductase
MNVKLGDTDISISSVSIGTWAWGEKWVFGSGYKESDLQAVYEQSLKTGINFFDTAEVYGFGKSEKILGRFIHINNSQKPIIATKFNPRMRFNKNALRKSLKNSLKRMGIEKVDLYQVHQPGKINQWVNAIADAYEDGLIRSVGVSNYNPAQFRQACDILNRRGINLASNQMHYSLLFRRHEYDGLLKACKEQNITFLAYMSLAQGVLTGKYTTENPPKGLLRRLTYRKVLIKRVQPLINLMKEIGEKYGSKTPSQIAINWVIGKGALPIIGVNNLEQLEQVLDATGWKLSDGDMAKLDDITEREYKDFYSSTFYRTT